MQRRTGIILLVLSATGVGSGLVWPEFSARQRVATELQSALCDFGRRDPEHAALSDRERRRLHAALQAEMPEPRWEAARVLGAWRDHASVNVLLVAMRDEDGTRRTCLMAQALGHIGDRTAVPELLWASTHPTNVDLRMCARHALAEIGDEQAVAPLIEQARTASDEQDRMAAISALGELGFSSAEGALRAVARGDSSPAIRARALDALWQLNLLRGDSASRLIHTLGRHGHWVSDAWILRQLAERWDERCIEPLNRFASSADTFFPDRVQACALLLTHVALHPATLAVIEESGNRSDRLLAEELRHAVPEDVFAAMP